MFTLHNFASNLSPVSVLLYFVRFEVIVIRAQCKFEQLRGVLCTKTVVEVIKMALLDFPNEVSIALSITVT